MKKELNLPKVDLNELEKEKQQILQERNNHAKMYIDWLKHNPDKKPDSLAFKEVFDINTELKKELEKISSRRIKNPK